MRKFVMLLAGAVSAGAVCAAVGKKGNARAIFQRNSWRVRDSA